MVTALLRVACLAGGLSLVGAAAEARPERVVSVNLCTDQLALMLAAPRQVISVSYLAQDPLLSVMRERALDIPVNHASAEEVFLLRPDLVLAGATTPPEALRLLRRLGVPVEVFPPETSFQDIRDNLLRMGRALDREARAEAVLAQFDADLAALQDHPADPPSAVLYAANGYVAGDESLAGAMLAAAGYRNLASDFGIRHGGNLPLEELALAQPDLVVVSERNPGHARAEEMLDHPALRHLLERQSREVISDRDWACGTPHVLRAVADLRALRTGEKLPK
ncbi:ABC transporter substrate-binding protein [Paracoccus ravus]|uniref:ABC transporter substrate-binding protein n=1 Tax=Paracoccus ravus TaxID=2447760 RepID=UPI00106E4495|nr:ABC transporter substrate-binding protein [Paracoccus ravus]